jgi:hypothetical protein
VRSLCRLARLSLRRQRRQCPLSLNRGRGAEVPLRLNKLDAGDFSAAVRVIFHVVGRVTSIPLPQVSTAVGKQGQVPYDSDVTSMRADPCAVLATLFRD